MKIKKTSAVLAMALLVSAMLGAGYYLLGSRRAKFEAPRQEGSTIQYRIGKEATLMGVVSNLYYYGFIEDENAFKYALEHAQDTNPGREGAIKAGNNTIDTQTTYKISQAMDAWELADVLLNKGRFDDCSHGCPGMFYPELLPGGDLAPSVDDRFKWVETYEDCVEVRGQLSSEQYSQRTGEPRKCVTPDGREFAEGQEGWIESRGDIKVEVNR